ncbi:MAG: RusA family crossover junction endodeoxyribonuclease [Ligilactobacillus animalis]|uniref:RusA family crossover junction endodeoxyribonuclease n=1 Tax=Ligilactobacillus animalis TaxID=1605 RepID=UPI00242CD93D|nr:RusA family crossover junction endodeoxyribonuclease [Ligilactobacillus animalis]MCI5941204.1 RusA family crossover junction endodeoxyribonuclease [Ligilactobacillus animalis]MDY2993639.1 RusA family crossover junction endodeoxyribonuclease [Ligilactobacillus animalis]
MILDIEPVEQARPRAVRRGKRIGMHDPPKVSKFKRELRMLAKKRFDDDPFDGELSVEIKFYRPIQKSLSKVVVKELV